MTLQEKKKLAKEASNGDLIHYIVQEARRTKPLENNETLEVLIQEARRRLKE